MRKALVITFFIFIFLIIELLIFNILGSMFLPNLMLLLVIFFNLYFGIRYSIFTAILAGFLKDSFGTGLFGINCISLLVAAYVTTLISRYIYQKGSRSSRLMLVALVCLANVLAHSLLAFIFESVNFVDVIKHVLVPDLILTLLVANFTFEKLKICVSKLFV